VVLTADLGYLTRHRVIFRIDLRIIARNRSWWALLIDAKRTRLDANGAMVHHTSLVPAFPYGVGYFFPLSLKFSAT